MIRQHERTSHKPPLAQVVIGLTLILLVAYPVSLGPALWVATNSSCPEWLEEVLFIIYTPLEFLPDNSPTWLHDLLHAYVDWASKPAPAMSL